MEKRKLDKSEDTLYIAPADTQEDIRTISLYGDVDEKTCGDLVAALSYLQDNATVFRLEDPQDENSKILKETRPIKMIISTPGGSAAEMFSAYDMMRYVKETCDIETFGLGKVMSAGVLLLAAGTKGKRKIGANCRVMIHSVMGGYHGSLSNMENEIIEVRWIQERYIKCITKETNLAEKQVRKMFKKHVDTFLSAEQAVEFGIADEIV